MNSIDIFAMAFKNLWRRKVRTILTLLGVIVGTVSIVVMLSLGIGMNESFKKQVSAMGSLNIITINKYYYPEIKDDSGNSYVMPQTRTLDDKLVEKLKKIDGVEAVTPLLYSYLKFVSGKYVAYAQVTGIDVSNMEAFEFKLSEGRLLNSEDTNAVVMGSSIVNYFYNPNSRSSRYWYYDQPQQPEIDVFNDKIVMTFDMSYGEIRRRDTRTRDRRNQPTEIQVVGLIEAGSDKDYSVYINIDYLKSLIKANNRATRTPGRISYGYYYGSSTKTDEYEQIWVKVKNMEDVERVLQTIKDMGYGASSLIDILRSMLDATKTIRTVLGAIGAVALFIAALGITNTMIMSIYERTKEIGVMKVIGCIVGDIRRLFLLESALIGFIGGLLGIGFSYGISYLLNRAGIQFLDIGWSMPGQQTQISIIPLWLSLAAVGFGTLVGIIPGAYPAARAIRISALEAIRNE